MIKNSDNIKSLEQIKISWPFCVVGVMFILLRALSTSGISIVPDVFFGITYILLASTFTYTCIKAGKKLQEVGKNWKAIFVVYGSGILSGLWLYQAIEYFS